MKYFQDYLDLPNIGKVQYWGYFEDDDTAQQVLRDLTNALSDNVEYTPGAIERYAVIFQIGDRWFVIRNGVYVSVITKDNYHLFAEDYQIAPKPTEGVLLFSLQHMDDLPKYTTAKDMCFEMSMMPFAHVCVPID